MIQKVLKVGSSAALTIPKKYALKFGIKSGDELELTVDEATHSFIFRKRGALSIEDLKVAKHTFQFIEQYRADLEALKDK